MFVCDIDAEGLAKLKQEIPGLETKIGDVSKRKDIEKMVSHSGFFADRRMKLSDLLKRQFEIKSNR